MSANEVRAGGAYVEILTKNEKLAEGLGMAKAQVVGFGAWLKGVSLATGAMALGSAALAAGAVSRVFSRRAPLPIGDTTELVAATTPLATAWKYVSQDVWNGSTAIRAFRGILESAGPSAQPLLSALDGILSRSKAMSEKTRWKGFWAGLFGDKEEQQAARMASRAADLGRVANAFKTGGRLGILGDFVSPMKIFGLFEPGAIRNRIKEAGLGGFGAALAVGTRRGAVASMSAIGGVANVISGGILNKLGSGLQSVARAARSMASGGASREMDDITRTARTATSSVSRLGSAMSLISRGTGAALGGLKSGSRTMGLMSAGILGPLAAAAASGGAGGIGEMFSAKGFAQHASGLSDAAKKKKISVESHSANEAAEKLSGISHEDATKDPAKMVEFLKAKKQVIALGGVITADQAKRAKEHTTALSAMGIALRYIGTSLGSAVVPQITSSVKWFTKLFVGVGDWIAQNPKLIQQVFTVGKWMGLVAATVAALTTGVGFLLSPIGAVTAAVGLLTTFFPQLLAQANETMGGMSFGLLTLKLDWLETFGGIMDALSSGNLSLAADVAWSGLMLVFNRGIAWLDDLWLGWKESFLGMWDAIVIETRVKLDEMFPGFELAFSETMGFLQDSWTVSMNFFRAGFDAIVKWMAKWINWLSGLFDGAFDVSAANKSIDQHFDEKAKGRGDEQSKLLADREAARLKRADDLKTKGTRGVLTEEAEAAKKQRADDAAEARKADQAAVDTAKKKLDLAVTQAAKEKAAKDAKKAAALNDVADAAKKASDDVNRKGWQASDVRSSEGQSLLAGTLRGGGGSPQQQLLGKGKETVDELKKNNEWQKKNWVLLAGIERKVEFTAEPIG